MITDIEFRHLSYFISITEEGSFGKAAKRPQISQPTLTTQIKYLEESGDAIHLIRGSRGTGLSPAGLLLLPLARKLLQTTLRPAPPKKRRSPLTVALVQPPLFPFS